MKRVIAISLVLMLAFSVMALAAGERVKQETTSEIKVEAENEVIYCPVMGSKITKATAYDSVEYKGQTYYFCCGGCKPAFLKEPEKYIGKSSTSSGGHMQGDCCR